MLFLLLGEVHPLIFHQVPSTSQISNTCSTWSWNIHTHNAHLPMVCEKQYEVVVWTHLRIYIYIYIILLYMLVKTGNFPNWDIDNMNIPNLFESSPRIWILYNWESPKNHSFRQKKMKPPGGLGKGSLKNGPHSFIAGKIILQSLPVPSPPVPFARAPWAKYLAARG